jgi:hypothetical protein
MISRTAPAILVSRAALAAVALGAALAAPGCQGGYNPKGWPEAPATRSIDDERACRHAGASGLAPIDRGAVEAAMAKLDLSACRPSAGGKVHVYPHVLLCTDGTPGVVEVHGDARGTPAGDCVSERYRTLRVPAFSGVPMHVRMHRVLQPAPVAPAVAPAITQDK